MNAKSRKALLFCGMLAISATATPAQAAEGPSGIQDAVGTVTTQMDVSGFARGPGVSLNVFSDNVTNMNLDTPTESHRIRGNSSVSGSANGGTTSSGNYSSRVETRGALDVFNVPGFTPFQRNSVAVDTSTFSSAGPGASASGSASGNMSMESRR